MVASRVLNQLYDYMNALVLGKINPTKPQQIQKPQEVYTVFGVYWGKPWPKYTNLDVDTHWLSGKLSGKAVWRELKENESEII